MTAQINGTAWTAICVTVASWPNNILSLGATDGSQSIGLGAIATGPGTYSMSTGAANATINLLPATNPSAWWANAAAVGSSGTLTVTRLDTIGAVGTFSFTAVPTPGTGSTGNKTVTNGTFSVTF